jgi:hypothetical protein
MIDTWKWTKNDSALATLPLNHFSGLVYCLLTPFYLKAQVELMPKFNAEYVWSQLLSEKSNINLFIGVPTVFNQLIDVYLKKVKQNYEENKEHKLAYQKQYAEEHKEEISEKQKEYREKNKEKLSEQKKEYRETHKEEASKAHKEWREANKEKLKEQKSQIINCECGSQYTFGNKHRHLQSKVHINYQNQLCVIIESEQPKIKKEEDEEHNKEDQNEEENKEDQDEEDEEEKEEQDEEEIIFIKQNQKQKEYREKNTDKIKEFKKKYNEENKKKIKEQTHNYYESHKEEIKMKTKEYVEENKEKVKEYKDSWYQKNKEKILEKQKQIFICECGSQVRCAGKAEHLRSTKHKNYIENL